jgi:exodeoxyribonuclease-3
MSLRVMTYNILNGGEGREYDILEVIQTAGPDLIILQEVFSEELLKFLSDALDMRYYLGRGNRKRKVALLSKLPVYSFTSHHPLFPIWRNFIEAKIEYEPNKSVRMIGVHPIASLGFPFEVWRLWEAKHIVRHTRSHQNEPYIIAGDFNTIAPGDRVWTAGMPGWLRWMIFLQGNRVYRFSIRAVLSAGFTDCFRFLNPGEDGFTLPPPNPNTRLDYIFVNAKMQVHLRKCRVVCEPESVNRASDHYPILAEFDLP